jgi:hypothetical protein
LLAAADRAPLVFGWFKYFQRVEESLFRFRPLDTHGALGQSADAYAAQTSVIPELVY